MNKEKKIQDNRFELREPLRSYLKTIRDLAGGDACALYLIEENMDEEEKRESFENRFGDVIEIEDGKEIKKDTIEKCDVLKFIGVADDRKDNDSFWRFDYKDRPDKYIVVRDSTKDVIEGECITGMIARKKETLMILNKDEIENHRSRKGVKQKGDTERRVHPPCLALFGIPIIKGDKIFGVLRIDLYEKKEFEKGFISTINSEAIKNSQFYLNRITQLIVDQSTKDASEQSYRKLYKGTKILEALKKLNKKQSINSKNKAILKAIIHLFFVFQRHTYIGHEEILKRVLYFIEDLGGELGLILPFTTLLEQFKDQEKLMLYDIEEYRDHFMHQFHVFVLGYIILNHIGLDAVSTKINARLKKTNIKDVKIEEINVLRIWTLIAFFHDICYLFQEYKVGIEKFIKDILKKDVPVNFEWHKVVQSPFNNKDDQPNYASYLQKLCDFFVSIEGKNTQQNQLLTNYYKAILSHQDHGVFSSLYLIENLIFMNKSIDTHVVAEAYLAGLSISLHNSIVFSGLEEGSEFEISFESFPLEFILIYCDILAEWGRERREKKGKELITLKGPELENFEYNESNFTFKGVLNYKEPPHFLRKDIDEIIKKRKSVFKAKIFKFQIECNFFDEPPLIEKFY